MTKRPALTGVRAIAVGAVILDHAGLSWLPGGVFGVDVFFVLSGYLITNVLLASWENGGSLDLRNFYRNRALRLAPALLLVVVAGFLIYGGLGYDGTLSGYVKSAAASVFYVQDFVIGLTDVRHGGLSITWSLAVEEQFYLLWPWVLLLLLRRGGRLWPWIVVLMATSYASLAYAMWPPRPDLNMAFFMPHTRAMELLGGALLSVTFPHLRGLGQRTAGWMADIGLVGVIWLLVGRHAPGVPGSGLALAIPLATAFTAALIAGIELHPAGLVARLLSLRPLVWIGTISYGMYLYHLPILTALQQHGHRRSVNLLADVILTIALASASYLLVEVRVLRQKRRADQGAAELERVHR